MEEASKEAVNVGVNPVVQADMTSRAEAAILQS